MGKIWEVPNLPYLEARKSEKITNNMGKIVLVGTVILRRKRMDWKPIRTAPKNKWVMTKIDDDRGARNFTVLKKRKNIWVRSYGSAVFWTPTHWCEFAR